MLALLHETQDFFVLKEIEKLATKSKGVVSQSVKEVLQELKDDRLIECEKIGTSNYYWAFPATAAVAKEAAFATQTAELASLRSTEKQLSSDVQMALVGREPAVCAFLWATADAYTHPDLLERPAGRSRRPSRSTRDSSATRSGARRRPRFVWLS